MNENGDLHWHGTSISNDEIWVKVGDDHVYREITKEIITTAGSNTQLDSVLSKAFQLESKFNNINDDFRAVHLAISHAHPVSEKQIEEAQRAIEKYMLMHRQVFPTYVTPKHHILERHCVAWLKRFGFGMGFHGEQGGEMLHSTVAKIERRTLGMRQESKKLACVLETSSLQTAPELTLLLPQVKKNKVDITERVFKLLAERQEKKEEAECQKKKEEAERQERNEKEEADRKEGLELEKMKLDVEMKLLQPKIEAGIIKNKPVGSGARSSDAGGKAPKTTELSRWEG
ncbi:amine oxidase [Plakobranchus ocellatus]|uniref:Amine oxidase n=1 Tax=Plakobranchus ocellatus TaxID=259542 RepID=A0AAV4BHS3_9GAST|nr:amine oxidase [Plakobranchus ocellatus]